MVDLNSLMGFGKVVMVNENEWIVREGEPAQSQMYVVFSGRVALYSNVIKKEETIKTFELIPEMMFGEDAIFHGNSYVYGARAVERSALICITRENFVNACIQMPEFAVSVVKGISAKLSRLYYKDVFKEPEQAKPKIETTAKEVKISAADQAIFPFGIKLYQITEPETQKDYIFDTEVKCPLCKKTFTAKNQLTSRLALIETEWDLHKKYKNFEPVWYNIWTCPHCYYSDLYYDFEEFENPFDEVALSAVLEKVKGQVKLNFTQPKNIDEAIAGYYIAIYCAMATNEPYLKSAKLWMQLSWLYAVAGDNEMQEQACKKALEFYEKMYYNSHEKLDPVNEQACLIVMAELYVRFGDLDRALTFLYNAKKLEGGNRYYMARADRRMDDVRDMRKEKEKQTKEQ